MVYDGHIHTVYLPGTEEKQQADLLAAFREIQVDGGMLISPNPLHYPNVSPKERIDYVRKLCGGQNNLFPFFWINPLDSDAPEQVTMAAEAGIAGIKIICSQVYPRDNRVLDVCQRAAELNKPVLFHSGILWDGLDSARYNRPGEFECLLDVPNLRFTLAHVSWPWCDECIAVYGKFANAFSLRPDLSCEMFIDITPGTPKLWRKEVLEKLYLTGYDVLHNVIFGTDCTAEQYNKSWCADWMETDREILSALEGYDREDLLSHLYGKNFLRFLGISDEKVNHEIPLVGV